MKKAMLSAVIIDDETDSITVLSELLKNFTTVPVRICGTATNLDEGIEIIKSNHPDIVFLDVDMPRKSGLEIYKYFNKPEFNIIFVTAYQQYAISALKNSASDYLLKPVDFMELRTALQKVSEEIQSKQRQMEIEDKASQLTAADIVGRNIVLEVKHGFLMENTKNIEYCCADQSYSMIVTYLGKNIIITKPLKELQKMLPANQFYRTHKSYLVNIHYIRKFIHGESSYVLMKSGAKIPVSVRISTVITSDIKNMLCLEE